eukprot:11036844-Alexandrium_andersonii.AAC.1
MGRLPLLPCRLGLVCLHRLLAGSRLWVPGRLREHAEQGGDAWGPLARHGRCWLLVLGGLSLGLLSSVLPAASLLLRALHG